MHRATLRAAAAAALAVPLLASPSAGAEQGPPVGLRGFDTVKLRPAPRGTHAVPGGTVTVSPTAIPAGAPNRRVQLTLTLDRSIRSGSFGVALPRRWLEPRGRLPYVRAVRGRGAELLKAGRRRELALRDERRGSKLTISLDGLDPPAGTYSLDLVWNGKVVDRAQVVVRGLTTLAAPKGPGVRAASAQSVEQYSLGSDPGLAFDQTGSGWYSFIVFNVDGMGTEVNGNRTVVNRLPAGGSAFQAQNTGLPNNGAGTFQDKPMIDVDTVPTSPHYGRIYVVWTENEPGGNQEIVISFCDTHPATTDDPARCDDPNNWTQPIPVTDATGSYLFSDVAAAPNGDVYVVWWNYSSDNRVEGDVCSHSSNCATTSGWGADQVVHDLNGTGGPIPAANCPMVYAAGGPMAEGRMAVVPSVDVTESGAEAGRVFVALSDIHDTPGKPTKCMGLDTDKHWDAFLGTHPAGGFPTSFTSLSGAVDNRDFFIPWMDVDQSSGAVSTAFYETTVDTGLDPTTDRRTARFVHEDASSTGTPSGTLTPLATADSDYSATGEPPGYAFDYGDYEGLAAANGKAYPLWTDGRVTFPCCEVLFRKFTLSGSVLGTETNLTHDANESAREGAETSVDTFGSGATTRVLGGANDLVGPGMLAFLSTDDGSSFTQVAVPLATNPPGAVINPPSGGGSDGGTAPNPTPTPPRDTTAAVLHLRFPSPRVLRKGYILISFRPSENVRATFRASLSIPGASRSFHLPTVTRSFAGDRRVSVRIKVSRQLRRTLKRALARHHRVTAKVRITATDAAGNQSTPVRHAIRIKR